MGDKWAVRYLNVLTDPDAIRERDRLRAIMTKVCDSRLKEEKP